MLDVLNFKKAAAHMSICYYGFSIKYIEFIEKTINAQLPDHLNDPYIFELVTTYEIHSRTWWKYDKNKKTLKKRMSKEC